MADIKPSNIVSFKFGENHFVFGTQKNEAGENRLFVYLDGSFQEVEMYELATSINPAGVRNAFHLMLKVGGEYKKIPIYPEKYEGTLEADASISREICKMLRLVTTTCSSREPRRGRMSSKTLIYPFYTSGSGTPDAIAYAFYSRQALVESARYIPFLSKEGASAITFPKPKRERPRRTRSPIHEEEGTHDEPGPRPDGFVKFMIGKDHYLFAQKTEDGKADQYIYDADGNARKIDAYRLCQGGDSSPSFIAIKSGDKYIKVPLAKKATGLYADSKKLIEMLNASGITAETEGAAVEVEELKLYPAPTGIEYISSGLSKEARDRIMAGTSGEREGGSGDDTPPTSETVLNAVKNTVTYKKGLDETKIEQMISLTEGGPLFSFSTTIDKKQEDGTTTAEQQTAVTVEKTADGKYIIRFKSPELFKSKDGATLESLGITKDGEDFILAIDPARPAISLTTATTKTETSKKSGTSLLVEIESTDGKKYKLSADATGISLEYGTEDDTKVLTHIPDFAKGRAISTNIDKAAIEGFLGNTEKIFGSLDAKSIKSFPDYLIGMYASTLGGNESKTIGRFTFSKFTLTQTNSKGKAKPTPYVFLTHVADDGTKSCFIYVKGKLQKCEKFLCLYDEKEDGSLVPHVLISGPRKDIYYGMPLPQDDSGLSSESQTLLSFIAENATNISAGDDAREISLGSDKLSFYKKDMRKYTDSTFSISGATSSYEEVEAEREPGDDILPPPDDRRDPPPPEQPPDDRRDPPPPEQPKDQTIKVDWSKTAETGGQIGGYLGLFAMAAAVLTPFGAILAPLGLALTLTGIAATTFSDIFKFSYVKKAKKAVQKFEEEEEEMQSFAERFLEAENEIDAEIENAHEAESDLKKVFVKPAPAAEGAEGAEDYSMHDFAELYDEFGIGFASDEGEEEFSRTSSLCGVDGYPLRAEMTSALTEIATVSSSEERGKLIDSFMETYFHAMPAPKQTEFKKLFDAKHQPQMTKLIESMKKVNEAHGSIREKRQSQILTLAESPDSFIEEIISSAGDPATRAKLLEAYAPTLIRRYMASDKGTASMSSLIDSIPASERAAAIKILNDSSKRINSKLKFVRELSTEHSHSLAVLTGAKAYSSTLAAIEEAGPDKYATPAQIEEATRKYLLMHEGHFYSERGNIAKISKLKTNSTAGLSDDSTAVANAMNSTLTSIEAGSTEIGSVYAFFKLRKELCSMLLESDGDGKALLGDAATQFRGAAAAKLPSLELLKADYKQTLFERLKKLAEQHPSPRLQEFIEKYEEEEKRVKTTLASHISTHVIQKIELELGALGIVIDEADILKEARGISTDYITFGSDPRNPEEQAKRIAKIKLMLEKKIAAIKREKTPANQKLLAHLKKAQQFVEAFVSGDLTNAHMDAMIKKSIAESESGLSDFSAEKFHKSRKDLFATIDRTFEVDHTISSVADRSLREKLREEYDAQIAGGKTAAEALKLAFKSAIGDAEYAAEFPTVSSLIAKYTDSKGKINFRKLNAELDKLETRLTSAARTEVETTRPDLGGALGLSVFEDGQDRTPTLGEIKYESRIELLADLADGEIDTKTVRSKLIENDLDIDKTLKALKIDKKKYEQALRAVVLTDRPIQEEVDIYKAGDEVADLGKAIERVTADLTIDTDEKLAALVSKLADNNELRDLLYAVKINPTTLLEEIAGKTKAEVQKILTKKYKVLQRLEKHKKETTYEKSREIRAKLADSRASKKLIEAETEAKIYGGRQKELETKLSALTEGLKSAGLSQAHITEALTAFLKGDDQFFADNPVAIEEPYFISSMDKMLIDKLGFSSTKLLDKLEKKGAAALVSYIKDELKKQAQKHKDKQKKLRKQTSMKRNEGLSYTYSSSGATVLAGATRQQMEARAHLIGNILQEESRSLAVAPAEAEAEAEPLTADTASESDSEHDAE